MGSASIRSGPSPRSRCTWPWDAVRSPRTNRCLCPSPETADTSCPAGPTRRNTTAIRVGHRLVLLAADTPTGTYETSGSAARPLWHSIAQFFHPAPRDQLLLPCLQPLVKLVHIANVDAVVYRLRRAAAT
eukprot:4569976-Pleurochrysis_carterae.AAC.2